NAKPILFSTITSYRVGTQEFEKAELKKAIRLGLSETGVGGVYIEDGELIAIKQMNVFLASLKNELLKLNVKVVNQKKIVGVEETSKTCKVMCEDGSTFSTEILVLALNAHITQVLPH